MVTGAGAWYRPIRNHINEVIRSDGKLKRKAAGPAAVMWNY